MTACRHILRLHTSDGQSSLKSTEVETVIAPTAVDSSMNGRLSQDSGRANDISSDVGGGGQYSGGGDEDNNASSGGPAAVGGVEPAGAPPGGQTTDLASLTSIARRSAVVCASEASGTPTRTRRFSVTTPRFSVSSPDADDDNAADTDASSRAVEGSEANAGDSTPSATTPATGRFAVRSPSPVGSAGVYPPLRLQPPSITRNGQSASQLMLDFVTQCYCVGS